MVVQADKRGRAAQMNVGAARARAAGADAVLFCHADTSPPQGAVAAVRAVLGDQTCCLGAFLPLIVSDGAGANSGADATAPAAGRQRTYWLLSAHNWIKSYYCPLLARPISFFRGLRLFFGDQCMFTRLDDFAAVGGFDEALPRGHEDWAFWLQLTRLPLVWHKIDEFLTHYRFKKNSKMRNRQRANPEVPRLLRTLFPDLYPVRKLLVDHHELLLSLIHI